MPRSSSPPRSKSRSSLMSNTTYHSFHDIEPQPPAATDHKMYDADNMSISSEMHRQDSGYESITPRDPHPRSRVSRSPRQEAASATQAASATSSRPASRTRPSTRRSAKSARAPKPKLGGRSMRLIQSNPVLPPSYYGYPDSTGTRTSPYNPHAGAHSYFCFPPPVPQAPAPAPMQSQLQSLSHSQSTSSLPPPSPPYDAPPQTTHYWTSDHTRRLEYAAIDAASRGFKGWLMRHMVPDCFVPKAKRRVTFDDDTGSVRRYRLELDESDESVDRDSRRGAADEPQKQKPKKRTGSFWT